MKTTSVIVASQLAALSLASPFMARRSLNDTGNGFIAPGANDFRGPCPMMNTLANHGFLPRDGRNITKENAVAALGGGLNFAKDLAEIMFEQAVIANPEPNATFFTLDQLNVHNVLEHDASLSRTDAAFGNNHIFNETVFNTSRAFWTADVVTAEMLANSKVFRQVESRATNPDYRFTNVTENFSLGEVAAPIIAFGDINAMTVPKNLMEFFFLNEKFPEELGWTKTTHEMSVEDVGKVAAAIAVASKLQTVDSAKKLKFRGLHGGMF